jgi:hypothetical protein
MARISNVSEATLDVTSTSHSGSKRTTKKTWVEISTDERWLGWSGSCFDIRSSSKFKRRTTSDQHIATFQPLAPKVAALSLFRSAIFVLVRILTDDAFRSKARRLWENLTRVETDVLPVTSWLQRHQVENHEPRTTDEIRLSIELNIFKHNISNAP